ncbi:unnamed protein product [Boreogadus saida]
MEPGDVTAVYREIMSVKPRTDGRADRQVREDRWGLSGQEDACICCFGLNSKEKGKKRKYNRLPTTANEDMNRDGECSPSLQEREHGRGKASPALWEV